MAVKELIVLRFLKGDGKGNVMFVRVEQGVLLSALNLSVLWHFMLLVG
jgi:hypothetical protein